MMSHGIEEEFDRIQEVVAGAVRGGDKHWPTLLQARSVLGVAREHGWARHRDNTVPESAQPKYCYRALPLLLHSGKVGKRGGTGNTPP